MDPATLYVLVFCTKMLSCYPVDGSGFDMTVLRPAKAINRPVV
jgi:hypothetical protein